MEYWCAPALSSRRWLIMFVTRFQPLLAASTRVPTRQHAGGHGGGVTSIPVLVGARWPQRLGVKVVLAAPTMVDGRAPPQHLNSETKCLFVRSSPCFHDRLRKRLGIPGLHDDPKSDLQEVSVEQNWSPRLPRPVAQHIFNLHLYSCRQIKEAMALWILWMLCAVSFLVQESCSGI